MQRKFWIFFDATNDIIFLTMLLARILKMEYIFA